MLKLVLKTVSLLMAFILPLTWNLPFQNWAFAENRDAPTAAELSEIVKILETMFQELKIAERDLPRETFDFRAIIQEVGTEPDKLFEWVRDHTFWVPYRGSLRGPTGVLMDRLGNSLDRSLLLAEFLRSTGHNVQLAHTRLSNSLAKKVFPRIRPVPDNPLPIFEQITPREIDKVAEEYAEQYGIDAAEFRAVIGKDAFEYQRTAEEVIQNVSEQAPVIINAVAKTKNIPENHSDQLAALRDHWWVQCETDDGWVDFDTIIPDAKPGRTLADESETIELDELSDNLLHLIDIRIIIEQWDKGALKTHTVLKHTLCPSELFGKRITISHYPRNWPRDLNLFDGNSDLFEPLKKAVLDQNEWLPFISIGPDVISQSSFTNTGEINEDPELDPAAKLGKSVGGTFGGMFGGLAGGESEKETKKDTLLTAEWIEYEIRLPGRPVRRIRRQIFDLLGAAARTEVKAAGGSGTGMGFGMGMAAGAKRKAKVPAPEMNEAYQLERGLALLGETEILPLVCQISPDFFNHLVTRNMLANQGALLDMFRQGNFEDPNDVIEKISTLTDPPSRLYSLAVARKRWSRYASDIYLDRPNIYSHHSQLRVNPQGQLVEVAAFDIVANDIAVRPGSDLDPFLVGIEQGVVDSNTEALMLDRYGIRESAAEIFAQAITRNIEWLCVQDNNDPEWQSAELPKDVRALIEKELTAGYIVLVPKKTIPFAGRPAVGWWRIDPKTGNTLAFGDRGWGQALTEYVEKVSIVMQLHSIIKMYGQMGRCLGMAMAYQLTGESEGQKHMLQKCIWDLVCGQVLNALGAFFNIKTDLTNFLIKKTISELWSGLCKGLWKGLSDG